jgi:hypothetical protein
LVQRGGREAAAFPIGFPYIAPDDFLLSIILVTVHPGEFVAFGCIWFGDGLDRDVAKSRTLRTLAP